MGEDYRSQTFGLKQMCLPHGRKQKYKGNVLQKKRSQVEKWARRQVSPVCPSPEVKSKQSVCFFLWILIILSTVNHGPLNVWFCSVKLATLLPWDKMCKGIERDRYSSQCVPPPCSGSNSSPLPHHRWRRAGFP